MVTVLPPTILETPCREWRGGVNSAGYGRLTRNGQRVYLHRWVWALANGPIPDGMNVLHRCDNRVCFRLDHLFLGSRADNVADMCAKGRHPNAMKTHCKRGHEFTPATTYIIPSTGSRQCLLCQDAVR